MTAVQAHGEFYEDLKTREYTGFGKEEYDSMKKNGYTSAMDLVEGLYVDRNCSIKVTKNEKVDCGDILRRMSEHDYTIIIGQWRQDGDYKVFHTEYNFVIKPQDYDKLWGTMTYEQVKEFDKYVKAYSGDNKDRDARKKEREDYKDNISDKNALMNIHPKLSGKQLRVQCSFKIDKMIAAGVEYTKKDINIEVYSPSRKFNK